MSRPSSVLPVDGDAFVPNGTSEAASIRVLGDASAGTRCGLIRVERNHVAAPRALREQVGSHAPTGATARG